jgi:hypothetical protein
MYKRSSLLGPASYDLNKCCEYRPWTLQQIINYLGRYRTLSEAHIRKFFLQSNTLAYYGNVQINPQRVLQHRPKLKFADGDLMGQAEILFSRQVSKIPQIT